MILAATEHAVWTPPRLVRRGAATAAPVIVGYVALWGVRYPRDQQTECVARGAFDELLVTHPSVACVVDHDPSRPLAHTGDGSLELFADNVGLVVRVRPSGRWAENRILPVLDRQLRHMSWNGSVVYSSATWRTDALRVIQKVESLVDVSFCADPANPCTTILINGR